jgi:cell division protein FtsL
MRLLNMRLLNLVVVAGLVLAAAYVYKIKFAATLQAERVAKLRSEIRRDRDATARLRAEWSQLDNPERVQKLALRHLALRPLDATQIDTIEHLPERPPEDVPAATDDPISALIETSQNQLPAGPFAAHAEVR